ncbi:MAG TPA: serine hydrolase domain-containing protein [Pyrinomonadaceae bacterium]
MSDHRPDEQISAFLAERIAAGDFPSAVYLVGVGAAARLSDALGDAVRTGSDTERATLETIYDLASLTKPLVTGLLAARRIESGEFALVDRIARFLPEFDCEDKRSITLGQLLTHTSGLPAWRPLYLTTGGDRARTLQAIAHEPLDYAPGTRVLYSDLGFITLGILLERLAGVSLADIARREIFEPLELRRTFFNPNRELRAVIAASEMGNHYEQQMSSGKETPAGYSWREHLIWGEVHDGNAYFLGGAAGHAGLFSTAPETQRLAAQFLPRQTRLLKPQTCALFRADMTAGLAEARSLAWQLAATPDSTAGQSLAPDSFGHLGFTGTSCWIDPDKERIYILLTNRTHAHTLPFVNINSVRRRFHTLAAARLDSLD